MYRLDSVYGKASYDRWKVDRPKDLSSSQQSADQASRSTWHVRSYRDLVDYVSFLAVMNKRLVLFYRGQGRDWPLLPAIFRADWLPPGDDRKRVDIRRDREHYWDQLDGLGRVVYGICDAKGLPRWRTLRDVREAQWAVIQHYELWPTPVIDVTSSLRVAASFALPAPGASGNPATGFVYAVGMPNLTASVTHNLDDQLVLARLNAVCPPAARRPHLQDGFVVGRFPFYDIRRTNAGQSDLARRLVAKFELRDEGDFWTDDFPRIGERALLPSQDDDELLRALRDGVAYRIVDGRVCWAPTRCEDGDDDRPARLGD